MNMKQFLTEDIKYVKLLEILEKLFSNKITRFSQLNSLKTPYSDIEQFAFQIYKRGILNSDLNNSKTCQLEVSNHFQIPKIDIIKNIQALLSTIAVTDLTFVIIDNNVYSLLKELNEELNFKKFSIILFNAHESTKNLKSVSDILNQITQYESNSRKYHIIGIGGGVTLDISGFVASILQAKLTLLPSTVLSTVDATLGGKTGVNIEPYGKNQVGSFYFCHQIAIIPQLFKSLPKDQVVSGLCEALKHCWLAGNFLENQKQFKDFFSISHQIDRVNDLGTFLLNNLNIKLEFIKQDPYETLGIRSALNFGHTVGHAIEFFTLKLKHPIPHGIAVAHGMLFIINYFQYYFEGLENENIYKNLNLYEKEIKEFKIILKNMIKNFEFSFSQYSEGEWKKILQQDKKNKNTEHISISMPQYGYLHIKNELNSCIILENINLFSKRICTYEHDKFNDSFRQSP